MVTSSLLGVVAPELGWVPTPRFLLRRDRILRLLAEPSLGRLVEVGCGGGALLHELAQRSSEATGLETSERARALASSIAAAGRGTQAILAAPDPTWRQDREIVCAFDVLEHIEHDGAAIEEWSGWLAQGGRLCISVPAHQSRWGAGDQWAGHWRRYGRRDLEALLVSKGFVVEHMECYGFPLGNLTEWYGERFYRRALRDRQGDVSKSQATSESGVERSYYVRKFKWLDSPLGRALLRLSSALQNMASRTDWGTGYLVLARKA
jgi:SAM-dependent methyltransferase